MMTGILEGDSVDDINNINEECNINEELGFICMKNLENKDINAALEILSNNNNKKKLSHEEKSKIYAALKLIENLYKQGLIRKHVYKNILNDYNNCVDLSDFG